MWKGDQRETEASSGKSYPRCVHTGARREGRKVGLAGGAEGRPGFDTGVVKVSAAERSGEMKSRRSSYVLVVVVKCGG